VLLIVTRSAQVHVNEKDGNFLDEEAVDGYVRTTRFVLERGLKNNYRESPRASKRRFRARTRHVAERSAEKFLEKQTPISARAIKEKLLIHRVLFGSYGTHL